MIGADPEFTYIGVNKHAVDAAVVGVGTRTGGTIGYDGRSGEVRPPAGKSAGDLLNNLHDVLFSLHERVGGKSYGILGGSYCENTSMALGGHIHFDLRMKDVPESLEARYALLDVALALPFSLVENQEDRSSRLNSGYGALSDVRNQRWGKEYRTLASWLVSRGWAERALTLGEGLWASKATVTAKAHSEVKAAWSASITKRRELFQTLTMPIWRKLSLQSIIKPLLWCIAEDKRWSCGREALTRWGVATPVAARTWADRTGKDLVSSVKSAMGSTGGPDYPVCFYPQRGNGVVIRGPMRRILGATSEYLGNPALIGAMERRWRADNGRENVTFAGVGEGGVERKIESVLKGLRA